jgi:hypothetical protein
MIGCFPQCKVKVKTTVITSFLLLAKTLVIARSDSDVAISSPMHERDCLQVDSQGVPQVSRDLKICTSVSRGGLILKTGTLAI